MALFNATWIVTGLKSTFVFAPPQKPSQVASKSAIFSLKVRFIYKFGVC